MSLELSDLDRALLNGDFGQAAASAMSLLTGFAEAIGASSLLDISRAHIDGCLYHGEVNLDFVERLAAAGGRARVPTTLNVGSLDLIHPELVRLGPNERAPRLRLMQAHEALGCVASFTCAPYQTSFRPKFGDQIAWGESNAIVFANSVIGARTNRYGDFIDMCCAITGRAPAFGLHLDEGRRGQVLFRLHGLQDSQEPTDALFVAVGYVVGERAGQRIPVIQGLPVPTSEDPLKALGAMAASSGAVALFHAPGITPEAPTPEAAFNGQAPEATIDIAMADLRAALARLSTAADGSPIVAVSLGTPHFSLEEFRGLLQWIPGFTVAPGVEVYINTGRDILAVIEREGIVSQLRTAGIQIVTDTCTYVTSIIRNLKGVVMTNSGKWAHYAPANLAV